MKTRSIAMKEAKAGKCLELEGFLKQYPEKDGWTECRFEVSRDHVGLYQLYTVLVSDTQQIHCCFPLSDSVIIKEHLRQTGELQKMYLEHLGILMRDVTRLGEVFFT